MSKKSNGNVPGEFNPLLILFFCFFYFVTARWFYPFTNWISSVAFDIFACSFKKKMGIPCPTCGGTRSAYYFVTGNWGESIRLNASVFLFSLYVMGCFFISITQCIRNKKVCFNSGRQLHLIFMLVIVALIQWVIKVAV